MRNRLTKSDFLIYMDAPRHLWAYKNPRIEKKTADAYKLHLADQGYEVESYAEQYIKNKFSGVGGFSPTDLLYQPTVSDGPFEARTDLLVRDPGSDSWDMYEVKSSSKVKNAHLYDATFQYLVFQKLYRIGKVFILHLDSEYIRGGELDVSQLFKETEITEKVKKLSDDVHQLRHEAIESLTTDRSDTLLSCIKPKECPCLELCHPDLPEYSIFDINGITKAETKVRALLSQGIVSVYDIPKDYRLSERQRFQVDVAISRKPSIDKTEIRERFHSLAYPLYFIDYESFNFAIPIYEGYKPYDQMPFQWSLHIMSNEADISDSSITHHEFICMDTVDPIPQFLSALQEVVGPAGSIVVWNKGFEGTQNRRMGQIHPQFSEFTTDMNLRLFDLMEIFRDQLYEDPGAKGSYSIKNILPLLAPDMSYEGMEIGDGATAMSSWHTVVYGGGGVERKEETRSALLQYCKLDTLAMVKVFWWLRDLVNI